MKVIQVTDMHLVPQGERLHGLDPRKRLDACIEDINANHSDAQVCIFTGDLTHQGKIAAYENLRECLANLSVPYHLMVGNHDDRQNFWSVFPDAPRDEHGFVQRSLDLLAGRFILLDTVEAGEKWGSFCERRAAWLRQQLAGAGDRPVYLFLHHPPFDIGIPSVDHIKLRDASRLSGTVKQYHTIRYLFFGHVHRPMTGTWCGVPYCTFRGTNHQVAFDFVTVEQVPKSHEPPAYAVIFVRPDELVVHFHDFLDKSALPLLPS